MARIREAAYYFFLFHERRIHLTESEHGFDGAFNYRIPHSKLCVSAAPDDGALSPRVRR